MTFPRYEKYKDSGVEWLGEIPAHWEARPVKHLGRLKGGAGFPHDEQGVEDEELSFHKVNALGQADGEGMLPRSENTISRETARTLGAFIFPRHTIVFAKVGAALLLGRIRLLSDEACVDNNMMGLVIRLHLCSVGFAKHVMTLVRFDLIANPGAVPSLNEGQIGNVRLPLPPLAEQTAIANFLDRETSKIDALVEEQRRLIVLLKEKRQAVISHAVTKGLDPSAKMKDSGIEWLGEIPAHWEVRKLRSLARLESGHTPSRQHPEYWVEADCVIPWFTLADVGYLRDQRNWLVQTTSQRISPVGMQHSAARLLPKGTVLLSRTASVGFSGVTAIDLAVSQDFAAWVCGPKLRAKYLLLCLRAMRQEFGRLMMGSTHQTIYMPDIEAFRVPVPTPPEQAAIESFVAMQTTKLDTLTAEAERAIELLQERRTALISAAVTGQIDVRGVGA